MVTLSARLDRPTEQVVLAGNATTDLWSGAVCSQLGTLLTRESCWWNDRNEREERNRYHLDLSQRAEHEFLIGM